MPRPLCLLLIIFFVACNDRPTPTPVSTATALPAREGPAITPAPAGMWQSYSRAEGLPYYSTTAVAVDEQGAVWVGTPRGAGLFTERYWTGYTTWQGLLSDLILDIAIDPRGVVWFGTDQGVSRYDGESWTHFTDDAELLTGYVHVLAVDRTGAIWFGLTGAGSDWAFGNGAARLDDGGTAVKEDDRWQLFPPARERMAGDLVSAIVDLGPAGVWFGMAPEGTVRRGERQAGIWRLLGAETADQSDDQWQLARTTDGLISNRITALAAAADGSVWIGTTAGLMHVEPAAVASFTFTGQRVITAADGLPSDRILALAPAPDGAVWVGTDAGLALVEGSTITTMTVADGLPANQIRAIALTPDGSVWLATPGGVGVRR